MRQKILFDQNWMFHKGDILEPVPAVKGPVYSSAKTERKLWGPASINYNDMRAEYTHGFEGTCERWEKVNLPHDYIIGQVPESRENNALGFVHYCNAWYRNSFTLQEDWADKRISLIFDGIATHATVYLNGCLIAHNFCGYTTFEADITDYVKYDQTNVVAVYVNAEEYEGWWYGGGGIYRHVWISVTDKICTDLWGVFVDPRLCGDAWQTGITVTVRNDTYRNTAVTVVNRILDEKGNAVGEASADGEAPLRELTDFKCVIPLKNPRLWDIDSPVLYFNETSIFADGKLCDCVKTRFGFRTVSCDPDKGFFLNGRPLKLKGVCGHQDFGLTGKAVPDNIHRYKAQLIKEMGANAYRTSHYPQTEALMDAFDELGILVMNETRWFESTKEGIEQLRMLIRRDRNRPSVFCWSTGNEEPYHKLQQGANIHRAMRAEILKLDSSRAVTSAVSNSPDTAPVLDECDIIGINYNHWTYEKVHEKFPQKAIFSSECCATGTTRGWYFDGEAGRGYLPAYDRDTNKWFIGREHMWRFIMERDWVMGGFQWIAFEHRGEAEWPRLSSQSGAMDLFLQKKDAFYQNQSLWTTEPMIHILPHWNHENRTGEIIPVWVYSNCDEVELIVNEKNFGRCRREQYGHNEWNVAYQPGCVQAIGYRDGRVVARETVRTSGKAAALVLERENLNVTANGEDIILFTCSCVDENGIPVPDAAPFVRFDCNANGKIAGTGSDISDHIPVTALDRQMRAGKISVAVRVGTQSGTLRLYASAENLRGTRIEVQL